MLGFFGLVSVFVALLYVLAPGAFDQALGVSGIGLPFLAALLVLICLLALATVRRWRWVFWLLMGAFLASAIAIPIDALQLAGMLPGGRGPAWYQVVRLGVSGLELGLGIAMLRAWLRTRRAWG